MSIDFNVFENLSDKKREAMIERIVQQKLSAQNFDGQDQGQQIEVWKNVVCTVWEENAPHPIFARDFIKMYCDNNFTMQYLIQGLSATNDIASIVSLCNAREELQQKDPYLYSSQASVVADFSVFGSAHDFDPMQRLRDLKHAGLSLQNLRFYCYAVVMRHPQHWSECVTHSQQDEQDFLFDALKMTTKGFTNWSAHHMCESWPKILTLEEWETRWEHMQKSNPSGKSSWIAKLLFSNQVPETFDVDMNRELGCVLNAFPGHCSEKHLPQWNALCSTLSLYPIRHQLEQRIEESISHYQNKRIQSALSVSAPSSVRKM